MRRFLMILLAGMFLLSCNKDKFTSAPQITFKSLAPNTWWSDTIDLTQTLGPRLTVKLTDAEGDLGFNSGDTAFFYVKNLTIPTAELDSFIFPDLTSARHKNMDVEVEVLLTNALTTSNQPSPYTDTLFYEVYVKDFAGNKSNVLALPQPIYYITR
jgi:hypothetical protein